MSYGEMFLKSFLCGLVFALIGGVFAAGFAVLTHGNWLIWGLGVAMISGAGGTGIALFAIADAEAEAEKENQKK